jgi:multidrug efflux pump
MKSFTDLFIKRPVLAMVVSFVILIAGLQAMRTLNVRQYPRSDVAAITVTTIYVGADAELVRGFITTPIERAIAAADGIDYIQSQSTQGQSLVTVRLKLNYDANKALSDVSARVDAIRNNLPPESQIPVIAIQAADSQFASAYLSFTSNILEPNEVTDYLVRLVQPRLTAVGGVQKADILGGRTFAMRIWMKPERMAALNISPSQVRDALAKNNFLAAVGNTKGSLLQVNLTANTDLHTADQFKQLVVRQDKNTLVRLGDIADVVLGAEDYNTEVRFSGQKAAECQLVGCNQTRSRRARSNQEGVADWHDGGNGLRRHRVHQRCHPRSRKDADRHIDHRDDRHLLVPRVVPLRHRAGGGNPDLIDRRHVPHASVRIHAEPADAAGDRSLGGIGGR